MTDRAVHDVRYAIGWARLSTDDGWTPAYGDFESGHAATIVRYRENESWCAASKDGVEPFYASMR